MYSSLNDSDLVYVYQIVDVTKLEFVIKTSFSHNSIITTERRKMHDFSNLQLRINNILKRTPNLKNMKPNKHLTGLFDRLIEDQTIHPTHISLYFSLFQCWNINRFKNPISITREEMMVISKIGSRATYHKCMRELNDKGYIKYQPTFNPFKGSSVQLLNFSEVDNIEI